MTAVLLGGLAAVDYVTGYLPIAQTDESRQAALAAAEAGVDDYVNRLNEDPNYWNDGSDASNVAMQGGGVPGGSVPNTGPWGWVPVAPGSSADFHYYVDTSDMTTYKETDSATASWGTIYITSTGKVGNVTRTIEVGVRQADFLSNLYLSNYNLVDPIMEADSGAMSLANAQACVVYGWAGQCGRPKRVRPVAGGLLDHVQLLDQRQRGQWPHAGQRRLLHLWGPAVRRQRHQRRPPGPADSPYWLDHACVGAGQFPHGNTVGGDYMANSSGNAMAATYQKTVPFPANASFIEAYTSTTANANLGCLYYGPTSITFSGKQMQVYSPDTPSSNTNCLGATPSTWLPLPANGVIYVANLPSTLGGNPTTCPVDSPILGGPGHRARDALPGQCLRGGHGGRAGNGGHRQQHLPGGPYVRGGWERHLGRPVPGGRRRNGPGGQQVHTGQP